MRPRRSFRRWDARRIWKPAGRYARYSVGMRLLPALFLLVSPLLLGTRPEPLEEQPKETRGLSFSGLPSRGPEPAQAAFDQHCGACHRSDRPTAKPKALAIFDLTKEGWLTGMTEAQVKSAIGR